MSNSSILQFLAESGFCLAVFYLVYILVLRKETCFQYNRFYLLASTLLALLLPLVEFPSLQAVGSFRPATYQLEPIIINAIMRTDRASEDSILDWKKVCLIIYGIGFCLFAFRFVRQVYSLRQIIRQHQAQIIRYNGIKLIRTNGKLPTFSFLRYIFLDNSQELSLLEQEHVLQHESVHVRQGHSYDMLYLELLHLLFWFNPLLLLYKKALVNTHEFIADACVLQAADKEAYVHLLAKQACLKMEFSIGNFFNKSLTLKRMKMIQQTNHRTSKVKKMVALPLLASLLFFFSSSKLPLTEVVKNQPPTEKNTAQNDASIAADEITAPQFPGGKEAMIKFLAKNVRYPAAIQKNSTVGNVVIQATIDKEGHLGNLKAVYTGERPLEQEVIDVLKKMPKWEPAQNEGTAIASTYLFPAIFIIKGEDGEIKPQAQPDLNEIYKKISADASNQPAYLAEEVIIVGYGMSE